MFKYHKGMVPKSVCELFTLNSSIHSYNTRNKDKIRSAYGKHKFMYRNFRFVSVHVWNYLASNIIINTSVEKVHLGCRLNVALIIRRLASTEP